ncbi:RHS repeat-associated core domain-containing protein, partial [Lysinibacillus boronitolerans]
EKDFIPFRYQGQYEDVEIGLYYNRFRYYDPDVGMYTQPDPIGLAGNNPTLYGYVRDPLMDIDPFGLINWKKISWTATRPKGTKQTYDVYQRDDIDWDKVRTLGSAKGRGMTNRDAANKYGLAPQLADGSFVTLHHLGQDSRGALVEASTRYHGVGKYGQDILHSQFGRNKPHPIYPINRPQFNVDTREYFKTRCKK